jgi:hypothetical protein
MIRHQNAVAMFLASAVMRHSPPWTSAIFNIFRGWMPLISALPRDMMTALQRLRRNQRQNHEGNLLQGSYSVTLMSYDKCKHKFQDVGRFCRWNFRVSILHILDFTFLGLTRSSCEKCNYRPSGRNRTCDLSYYKLPIKRLLIWWIYWIFLRSIYRLCTLEKKLFLEAEYYGENMALSTSVGDCWPNKKPNLNSSNTIQMKPCSQYKSRF